MSVTSGPDHGVMEGKGSYNRHSRIPAGGGALALPLLEEAVRKIELDDGNAPVVVADYGSSQGKNSLTPMRAAIRVLRERMDADRPVFVFHIDQSTNDFNTLFEVLTTDPERYALDEPNVFSCAIGRSFYETVFPPGHVHLGWCSYAAVWLSRIPGPIPGHFVAHRSTGDVHAAFERQAAQDWKAFLSLRARELRSGGRLVVVLPGLDDEGESGLADLFDHANRALTEMVDAREIRAEERERMVLGTYPRRRCELLAPFRARGQFQDLRVERCDLPPLPDAAWADYERDGNVESVSKQTCPILPFRFCSITGTFALAGPGCRAVPHLRRPLRESIEAASGHPTGTIGLIRANNGSCQAEHVESDAVRSSK
ncbi:MAG: hypothetical protein WAK33_14705 [Silvibacterium sp.]